MTKKEINFTLDNLTASKREVDERLRSIEEYISSLDELKEAFIKAIKLSIESGNIADLVALGKAQDAYTRFMETYDMERSNKIQMDIRQMLNK